VLKQERLGVNDGPGEAANVCCASSASQKRGSPLRLTNACSVDQGRADCVEKRDSHRDGPGTALNIKRRSSTA
jgi:hypothetical protein